jgi:hypothetical protein
VLVCVMVVAAVGGGGGVPVANLTAIRTRVGRFSVFEEKKGNSTHRLIAMARTTFRESSW